MKSERETKVSCWKISLCSDGQQFLWKQACSLLFSSYLRTVMSLDLAEVSQCVLPGNNRNELEIQWPESDTIEANNDQLVSIRFYIPPDPEADPSDKTQKSSAELLQSRIMQMANIRKTTGDVIVEFDLEKGSFLTPRGRYSIELCTCMLIHLLYS